jgi:hypothetical protein
MIVRYFRIAAGWELAPGVISRYFRISNLPVSSSKPIRLAYASDRIWELNTDTGAVKFLKHERGIGTPVDEKEFTFVQLAATEFTGPW